MSYHQAVWEVASGVLLNSNCANSALNKDIWCWCHPGGTSDLAHFRGYVSWQDTLDNDSTFAIFARKILRELLYKSLQNVTQCTIRECQKMNTSTDCFQNKSLKYDVT